MAHWGAELKRRGYNNTLMLNFAACERCGASIPAYTDWIDKHDEWHRLLSAGRSSDTGLTIHSE